MVIIEHLSNNIPVVIEQMNCVRSVSLGLTVRAGSAHEFANNNGCAHLVEHMLFKGTKNRSAKKLADDISRMGGNMNAYTSKESTSYYFTTIDSCLQEGIDIVADLVQYPLFDAMEFEKEKLVVLEEIDMYEDSPEDVVHEYLEGAIWEGNPLSFLISGTRRSVESICIRDVEAFWKEHYCPQNMLISIAGNVDVNRVMGWLEESFRLMSNKSLGLPPYLTPVYHKFRDSR